MGKGDKKTRRGKIFRGTYGIRRRRKKSEKPAVKHGIIKETKTTVEKKPERARKEAAGTKILTENKEKDLVTVEVADDKAKKEDTPVISSKEKKPAKSASVSKADKAEKGKEAKEKKPKEKPKEKDQAAEEGE
jgi:30S ribosomal protein S31